MKKRLIRERNERALKGGYDLIYPFVSYEEEQMISSKVSVLRQQGHQGQSVKTLLGGDAPKTVKEKA